MRAYAFASVTLLLSAVACGSRTPFEDADGGVNHNETLTGGFGAGASSAAGKSGSGTAGTSPVAGAPAAGATGAGAMAGNGAAGKGAGGTGNAATGGTGTAGSGTAGTGAAGKAGGATAGTGGKSGTGGTTTSTGGTSSSTGGTGAGAFGGACDAAHDTGCAPGKQKCSAEQTMGQLSSSCVPVMGSNAEGADCTRQKIGFDNCAPGLICTGVGVVDYDPNKMPPHRQCRKFCAQDSDCGMTQACDNFTQDGFGVCIDICVPFSACDPATTTSTGSAGNNGGASVSCSDLITDVDQSNGYFTCHKVGKGTTNAQCAVSQDCAAGYFCGQGMGPMGGSCTQLCDINHPCDGKGLTCSSDTADTGFCQ